MTASSSSLGASSFATAPHLHIARRAHTELTRRSPRCVATALCRRRFCKTFTDKAGSATQLPEVEFDGVLTKRMRHVNFCLRCGTRVEGAFCANCGASTSLDQHMTPEGELEPEVPSPKADVMAQPVAVPSVALGSFPANGVADVSLPVNEDDDTEIERVRVAL